MDNDNLPRHLQMFLVMNPELSANYVRNMIYNSLGVSDFQKSMGKKHRIWMADDLALSLYQSYWGEYSRA